MLLATVVAWLGIAVAFSGEASTRSDGPGTPSLGMAFVFGCALTYAAFLLLSGPMPCQMGPAIFTPGVVAFPGLFVIIHYPSQRPVAALLAQPLPVYGWAVLLATVSTIIPSYLMGMGVARAGAARFAIIGTRGPVLTVLPAWWMPGEHVNAVQEAGSRSRWLGTGRQPAQGNRKTRIEFSRFQHITPSLPHPECP